jgi:Bacteriocin-protection, YdeI or OmpD-Associated/Domain of unknown function (DUF1905)
MAVTYKTTLLQAGDKNAAGISVPSEILDSLGAGKKPRLKVTINGTYSYSITGAMMDGVYMMAFNQEHRKASGVKGGDEIEVTLELDTAPPVIDVPDDLAVALAAAGVRAAFDTLAPSARKEHVRQVVDAKAPETRARRIANIVAKLG